MVACTAAEEEQPSTQVDEDEISSSASVEIDDDIDVVDDEGADSMLEAPVMVGRRLWDTFKVHPNGVLNWRDTENCKAVLSYNCPCGNLCLERLDVISIYEFRRQLRANGGGMRNGSIKRDVLRKKLEAHYDHS